MRRRLDYLPQPPPQLPYTAIGIPESSDGDGSSKGSLNSSLIIISFILMAIIVIVIILHLLLRYLSGSSTSSSDDHHVASVDHTHHAPRLSTRRVSPEYQSLIDSLPLFSFDSVTGLKNSSAVDCAVCLSKLEPHDQLRLLPLCCHAFHARCIDTWLASSPTCPLCRSNIRVDESEQMVKLAAGDSFRRDSFRLEVGSVSRRSSAAPDSGGVPNSRRSYSMGSYEYVVEEDSEVVVVGSTQMQGAPDYNLGRKDTGGEASPAPAANAIQPEPPGGQVAAEVGGDGRSWLKDYVDRLASSASSSFSSRTLSCRFAGRIFTGSSRRSDVYSGSNRMNGDGIVTGDGDAGNWDLEGNWVSEEMGSFFRWLSGV